MKIKSPAQRWSIEKILCDILKLPEVSAKYAQNFHSDLYSAAIRLFGSWKSAVEAAGFNYAEIRQDWVSSDSGKIRFRKKKGILV